MTIPSTINLVSGQAGVLASVLLNKAPRVFRLIMILGLLCSLGSGATASGRSGQPGAHVLRAYALQAGRTATPGTTQVVPASGEALVSDFEVNGLKVIVKRRPASLTVAAGLFIRGGSRNLTAQNAGIEALMLNAATEASTKYPREQMRREIARMGTIIGYTVNHDYSELSLMCTRANLDPSWDVFADVAVHPRFAPDDVARVKNQMLASLRDEDDTPDSYLEVLQEKVAYAGHPYLNSPQGKAATIAGLTPIDLKNYHQQIMQTSHLLLVIVGDVSPEQLKNRIESAFKSLPRGNYRSQMPPQLSFSSPSVDITSRELPTNYIQGLFAAPPLTSPDIYPMRIASSILRERVFEEVRVKRNLSYAPSAFLGSQGANIGGIYVTAKDANQTISVMLGEINRLQRELISPDEVSSVVSEYLTNYYLDQETNSAQASELAMYEMIGGGWRNAFIFIERLRAVTPQDVQRVARDYMRNIRFVVLGNPQQIDKAIFTSQVRG